MLIYDEAKKREISWEEFCANQKRSSFWILVDGYIYDITKFIKRDEVTNEVPHPGGNPPIINTKTFSNTLNQR